MPKITIDSRVVARVAYLIPTLGGPSLLEGTRVLVSELYCM
jgi:hypothetical protein